MRFVIILNLSLTATPLQNLIFTLIGCGGICIIANLNFILNAPVKEFLKSVNI